MATKAKLIGYPIQPMLVPFPHGAVPGRDRAGEFAAAVPHG